MGLDTVDRYPSDSFVFSSHGCSLYIDNELVAAFADLSQQEQSIMFIMTTGQIMSMGFDQIFNMSNAAVKQSVEVLDMYIYRITFQSATDFSFSTAVSLFRSVLNMAFLVLADRGSKLLGGGGLFG